MVRTNEPETHEPETQNPRGIKGFGLVGSSTDSCEVSHVYAASHQWYRILRLMDELCPGHTGSLPSRRFFCHEVFKGL